MQEDTLVVHLAQKGLTLLLSVFSVEPPDVSPINTQLRGDGFDLSRGNLHARAAATFRARSAIEFVEDPPRSFAEMIVGDVVGTQVTPEPEIFLSRTLRETADLDQVRQHASTLLLLLADAKPRIAGGCGRLALHVLLG